MQRHGDRRPLLVEHVEAGSEEWAAAASSVGELGDVSEPWEGVWRGYIRAWLDAVIATPGGRALVLAMREDPVLRAVDDVTNRRFVAGVAEALQQRRPDLDDRTADIVARVLLRSTVGVLDDAVGLEGGDRDGLVAGLLAMHCAYLAQILGADR